MDPMEIDDNDDEGEFTTEQVHLLRLLPEDATLQIFDMMTFPLHRYAHLSTLDNPRVKFRRMAQILYGYFPLSSLSHRKVHLLFRNITLRVNQCMSHRGEFMRTLSLPNDIRLLQLIPISDQILSLSVQSLLFFKNETVTMGVQAPFLLGRIGQGLKVLDFSYQPGINDEVLPLIQQVCNNVE